MFDSAQTSDTLAIIVVIRFVQVRCRPPVYERGFHKPELAAMTRSSFRGICECMLLRRLP